MGTYLAGLAVLLFAAAATTDILWRRIPNGVVLALLFLGAVRVALLLSAQGASALPAALVDTAASAALLVLGTAAFSMRLIGGGDVKLIAAGALWLGLPLLMTFLLVTALAGGALALAFLAASAFAGRGVLARGLPYGVAIAAGGIVASTVGSAVL